MVQSSVIASWRQPLMFTSRLLRRHGRMGTTERCRYQTWIERAYFKLLGSTISSLCAQMSYFSAAVLHAFRTTASTSFSNVSSGT